MQILFISEEQEIIKFLSGFQAEGIMPQSNVEVMGLSDDSFVTVICSGTSIQYQGTITNVKTGYQSSRAVGKWLDVRFMVQRYCTGAGLVP